MAWRDNDGVNASQDSSPVSSLVTVANFNKRLKKGVRVV